MTRIWADLKFVGVNRSSQTPKRNPMLELYVLVLGTWEEEFDVISSESFSTKAKVKPNGDQSKCHVFYLSILPTILSTTRPSFLPQNFSPSFFSKLIYIHISSIKNHLLYIQPLQWSLQLLALRYIRSHPFISPSCF